MTEDLTAKGPKDSMSVSEGKTVKIKFSFDK